ncbi:MAG: hypothetical protein V2I43_26295 [Parvularcula sp.]|nr:hypothetical protein [Parvularcula sp.]
MASDKQFAEVDKAMSVWRQGDVVLGANIPFMHVADLSRPLTDEAQELADEDPDPEETLASIATTIPGFVVLSQTCDLVRSCQDRPYVEVAPLKEVASEQITNARRIPAIAIVPEVAEKNLVADLDRVMTLEKSVLAALPENARTEGCRSDDERSDFASALARKRYRFAFPDDFNVAISKLRDRIIRKHGKPTFDKKGNPTAEGEVYEKMREIRVLCPDWDASPLDVTFLFIFETRLAIPGKSDRIIEEELMSRVSKDGRCSGVEMRVVGLDELPAADWLASQQLDYDHLSGHDED